MKHVKLVTPILLAFSLLLSPALVPKVLAKSDKGESHSEKSSYEERKNHQSKSEKQAKEKSKGNGREKQEAVDKLVNELGLKNRGQLHKLLGALNSGDIRELEASDIPLKKVKQDLEAQKSDRLAKQRITKLAGAVETLIGKEKKTTAEISAAVTDVLELLE